MSGGRGWHVTGARRGSRPSPKRGPATPSRLALNEASWSGTARSAGYEWISEPAARVYDRLTPACPNNLERQKRLLDLLIRVELRWLRPFLLAPGKWLFVVSCGVRTRVFLSCLHDGAWPWRGCMRFQAAGWSPSRTIPR